ncbi:MAG: protein kinase [Candidatus Sumerlaeia bacterium]|nr:protein kinase [Candidatus Sumerlaeia bacterium]
MAHDPRDDSAGEPTADGERPTRAVAPHELETLRLVGRPSCDANTEPTTAQQPQNPPPHGTPMTDDLPLIGDEIRGTYRYRLDERLGAGAFGSVYRATCLDRERGNAAAPPETVAVKIFHMPDKEKVARLIRRELQPLLMLDHPRIPKIYDWAVRGPVLFLVMQYFPAGSIHDNRQYFGTLTEDQGWQLLTDLLSALRAAHSVTMLHLDIKPGNVLLDGRGGFVLTDFGIAQGVLVPWRLSAPGLGTVGYRSAEQQEIIDKFGETDEQSALDMRSDLYGVGATVWAVFAGFSPSSDVAKDFESDDERRDFGLPRLSRLRPDCSQEFEQTVMSLLRLRRDERPGSAAEVLATIRRLRGERGLDSREYANVLGLPLGEKERLELIDALIDPVWIDMCKQTTFARHLVRFEADQTLIEDGDTSYLAYVLLQGKVTVERAGKLLATLGHEGAFIGEVATLTGRLRTATVRAQTPVVAAVFNAAELERLVVCNPAVGLRLIKTLANRFSDERHGPGEPTL